MFDAAFRRHCEALHNVAQRAWGHRYLGRKIDQGSSAGTELTGHNDYTSGNDFRHVDWNRCARHDELLSKQFRGREQQTLYLLVDNSLGMGVQGGGKFALAARLAAALGYLALRGTDDVVLASGATVFPAVRGQRQIPQFLEQVASLRPEAKTAALKSAAERLLSSSRRRGLTVVLSDLYDPLGYTPAVDLLRRNGYAPHMVQIYSPVEADPQWLGAVRLSDVSAGRAHRQRLDGEDVVNYRFVFREFLVEVRGYCRRHSLGLLQTSSEATFEDCVRSMVRVAVARAARGELAFGVS